MRAKECLEILRKKTSRLQWDPREDGDDEQKDEDPDLTRERPTKLVAYFGGRAEEDAAAPRADITAMLDRIMEMNIERRVSVKGSDASSR